MWGDVPYDPDEARRTLALLSAASRPLRRLPPSLRPLSSGNPPSPTRLPSLLPPPHTRLQMAGWGEERVIAWFEGGGQLPAAYARREAHAHLTHAHRALHC